MKLADLNNLVPGTTVDTKNPIRDAIRSRRTADLKAALLQNKGNRDAKNNEPGTTAGEDIVDPTARVLQ